MKTIFGSKTKTNLRKNKIIHHNFLQILTGKHPEEIRYYLTKNLDKKMETLGFTLHYIQNMDITREDRRKWNKAFMDNLTAAKGTKAKAVNWVKKNCKHNADTKKILDDMEYSATCLQKLGDWNEDLKKTAISCLKTCWQFTKTNLCKCCNSTNSRFNLFHVLKTFFVVAFSYIDLIKDTAVLVTLLKVFSIWSLLSNFTSFTSQIIGLQMLSITFPLLMSAVDTASTSPLLILGSNSWNHYRQTPLPTWKLQCIQVFTVLAYPLIPAVLILKKEETKNRIEELLKQGKEDDHSELSNYLEEVRKGLLIFKRNEYGVEIPIQLTLQAVVIFLGRTASPTHTGLYAIFNEDKALFSDVNSTIILWVSISISMLSFSNTYIKIKTEENFDIISLLVIHYTHKCPEP